MVKSEHPDILQQLILASEETKRMGEDLSVTRLSYLPQVDYPIKINSYGCALCLQGESEGKIDLAPYRLQAMEMVVNMPGQLIEAQAVSKDFRAVYILMSKDFINSLGLSYNAELNQRLRSTPLLPLSARQMESLLSYTEMVERLLENEGRRFLSKTLQHLTCAFFYGLGEYLYQLSDQHTFSNKQRIVQDFLDDVRQHYRKERKVKAYADRLCVTQNYLSTVVKSVSNKTPTKWIDDFVSAEARFMLRSTRKTIQQISDELNFPSQSFFGKYFKRTVGMSPKEYRVK